MALRRGRAGEIRTHDLLHPMQAFYQAELQPDLGLTFSPAVPLWGGCRLARGRAFWTELQALQLRC